jgi:glycosyltransferase involved in cell wall biosynthesis
MTRADARAALGWRDDTCHVLAVGRLNPVKRFDQLVRACVLSGRAMHLTVLGEGDARALHHIVNGDEASRVTLEVQSVAEVELHLFAADVYVSSSRNESFGMANLEALEAGLPAICTAVGGVPEVTGGGAWLVPPGDDHLVAVLAQALVALIDNPQRRNQLAEAGRQHARTWPDSDTLGQRHEAIYRDVA